MKSRRNEVEQPCKQRKWIAFVSICLCGFIIIIIIIIIINIIIFIVTIIIQRKQSSSQFLSNKFCNFGTELMIRSPKGTQNNAELSHRSKSRVYVVYHLAPVIAEELY